ncbi:MAG: nucleotide exchange factor GrpE [Actinomycetota bacterium]
MTERNPPKVTDKRHGARSSDAGPVSAPDLPEADGLEPDPVEDAVEQPVDEVAEARARAAEYLDDLRRARAEFENYRKRTVKEQTRALEFGSEGLVRRLLEVLDEFQLALASAEDRPELEPFTRGFQLVHAKLLDALRAEGLEPVDAVGRPFDPEVHEALMGSSDDDGEHYVEDVLRTGYRLKGRVIRPAGVRVGTRRPAEAEESPEAT